uniref:Uncharacterized protein n=1 Tax=Curvibacter symbiont subsp. Hydra magnipapillata TaxID=667019 RepID=C9Y7I8_CURXX|nr:hypothetical protein Csp_A00890 [Curvibacter putative symbiont of Hydra magnipapillata]
MLASISLQQWNRGESQSEVKEEAEGRGTRAAGLTPVPLRAKTINTQRR